MTNKRTIVQNLITHMKLINGQIHNVTGCPFSPYTYKNNIFNNVSEQLLYLEAINDFPSIAFMQSDAEQRFEQGGGEVYGTCNFLLRCWFMASENEEQADDFIEDLQYSLNTFKYTQISNPDLLDLRILAISSDEKILDPHGLVEIHFVLFYRLTI